MQGDTNIQSKDLFEKNEATIEKIKEKFFADHKKFITVYKDMLGIPVIVANINKSTRSFSAGQIVYIYGGYWGEAERTKVVGRYRRKHRFILGVCPIANLESHRPNIVYDPRVIQKLDGQHISASLF